MDLNFCPVCEKHIEAFSEDEDRDEDNLPPPSTHSRTPSLPNHSSKLQKAKPNGLKAKPINGIKRNQSSGRLVNKGIVAKALAGVRQEEINKAAQEQQESPTRESWRGFYCSAECMEEEELRSRLALSDLSTNKKPCTATSQARRPSSTSSYGYSSDDLPSPTFLPSSRHNNSGDRLSDYFTSPGSLRRNSKPSSLALAAYHDRVQAGDRGSSDSLASRGSHEQPLQQQFNTVSAPRSSRSGLRAMTPIHSTFSQIDSSRPMSRSESVESQGPQSSSDEEANKHRFNPQGSKPSTSDRPGLNHQKSRSFSATRSGIMPSRTAAVPVLSQGIEGNAFGTVFSRSLNAEDHFQNERPGNRRHNSSTASIPHLSCSPSSPASSTWSTRSGQSTASSTAPSDGYAAKSEHFTSRHRNHSSLSVPHVSLSQRTPSVNALPSYFSRSPPGRSSAKFTSSSFSESQGTISRIIHEKAVAKYNNVSASPPMSSIYHPTFTAEDALAYPSSPGEATPTQSEGHLKRIGSSASVSSLPHYFGTVTSETIPRRQSAVNLEASVNFPSGTSPSSASKGWKWDTTVPQYTAMKSKKLSVAESERKRLFFFDQNKA